MAKIYEYEVHRRLHTFDEVREAHLPFGKELADSRAVARMAEQIIGALDQEMLLVFHLNAKNKTKGFHHATRGGLASCPAEPSQVFRAAVMAGAVGIVLCHNHPSGDPAPSASDFQFTKRIAQAAPLLGIQLLDHVVLGEPGIYYSMLDSGSMPASTLLDLPTGTP